MANNQDNKKLPRQDYIRGFGWCVRDKKFGAFWISTFRRTKAACLQAFGEELPKSMTREQYAKKYGYEVVRCELVPKEWRY